LTEVTTLRPRRAAATGEGLLVRFLLRIGNRPTVTHFSIFWVKRTGSALVAKRMNHLAVRSGLLKHFLIRR